MKITKPFQNFKPRTLPELPIWFFEDVEIPDLDFDSINWDNLNKTELTSDKIYESRMIAIWGKDENYKKFSDMRNITRNIIQEIKENHPRKGVSIIWPINTWVDSNPYIHVKRDLDGFHMGPHLDNRNTKWTLIMNLKDNNNGTRFHIGNDIVTGPTTKGSGVFYFNQEDLWHSIGPVEGTRYILFHTSILC